MLGLGGARAPCAHPMDPPLAVSPPVGYYHLHPPLQAGIHYIITIAMAVFIIMVFTFSTTPVTAS